ncbi:Cof-type HAD-IIB family hydrolase [Brevibacillus sp. MCWH]|jgi:Cof subfamily protein (haloacid dehalogenase superfamily)|uniref:Cof-type HAD-IIB family hydrolase n=1 Tax=Brevibacillus sp. MCWH TaxID=2508871 RepID=UPI000E36217B|nr:Cof-type HAD-IIB family hydrolase [Brevibacillus sp. MCWH]NNV03520.1 Cof-type HAD-IIB family hydrolase [Brevibacillus sp. MCWH]REK61500.1 MAG: Cof-type HAD-IIB family hydrolase [Brevibacillus sp.]
MSYKIVFFDIDGTLLNTDHTIPEETRRAVRQLQENGVLVAIATGRAPFHLLPVAQELGIDTYVGFNGSYVVVEGRLIRETPLSRKTLADLEATAHANGHPMVFLSADTCYANTADHPHVIESFHSLRLAPPVCRQRYWEEASIYQAFLYCGEQEEHNYFTRFRDDVSFVRWHRVVLDVLPPNGSKARGIEAVLRHYGLKPEDAVAFGDGLNDREMLAYVGMGVAMGNAHEQVKPLANMVTRHVNDAGIHYGLRQLGLI